MTAAQRGARERMLVGLDIDGTLIFEDESPSPGVYDAIAHATRQGHEVTLATGRSWVGTDRILELFDMRPEYVVCSNGAVIMERRPDGYERVHVELFDPTEVLGLLRTHLPDANYMVELENGGRLYTDVIGEWTLINADRVPFEALAGAPVSRVVVVSPGHDEEDFAQLVERIGLNHVSYAVGWTAWLDIAPFGVDKGTALTRVREWLGIAPEDVLVMGDGRNDIGMFGWALDSGGRAVAMGQAPQDVKDAAGEVTASVDDGGAARVLDSL